MISHVRFLVAASLLLILTSAGRADDLFDAINKPDADGLAKMLKADPELANKPNANGQLPLHSAVRGSSVKIVQLLLDAGADVNKFDGNGFAAMHFAAGNKDKAVIELLIANDAKIDVASKNSGVTPLHFAARQGNKQIAALLLDKGARIDGRINANVNGQPWTPLYEAVEGGHLAMAEFLLAHGADPNAQGSLHGSPFDKAAEKRDRDMVRLLLAHGADAHSERAVLNAIQSGDREVVELFLKRGIDMRKQQYLIAAATRGKEMTELLLDHGARADTFPDGGPSPLATAAMYGDVKTVGLLITRGFSAKHLDNNQAGTLHYAKNAAVAELLIASGADVNATSKDGKTPMHAALARGNAELVETLAKRGAKLDAFGMAALGRADELRTYLKDHPIPEMKDKYYPSPLHLAATFGQNDTIAVLLDKGADINGKTWDKQTPLHLAAAHGHKETVEFLLKKGADINAQTTADSFGPRKQTPLQVALAAGQVEVVRLLVDKGALPKLEGQTAQQWWQSALALKQPAMLRYFIEQGLVTKADDLSAALLVTAEMGDLDVVKFLVAKGAAVKSAEGTVLTPLSVAARGNQKAVVEFLLSKGADANERYPLRFAAYNGHKEVVELLVSKGASVNVPGDISGMEPLQSAVVADHLELVKWLLAKGADPKKDATLLHFAALRSSKPIVEALLAAGMDVNGSAKQGFHLYYAQFQKRPEVLDFFQDLDPAQPPPQMLNGVQAGTPLQAAVAAKRTDVAELLLAKGAKIDMKLPNGSTVLHLAAYLGDVDTAKLLLANKVEVNAKDRAGLTALQIAEREGRKDVANLLRKHGAKD